MFTGPHLSYPLGRVLHPKAMRIGKKIAVTLKIIVSKQQQARPFSRAGTVLKQYGERSGYERLNRKKCEMSLCSHIPSSIPSYRDDHSSPMTVCIIVRDIMAAKIAVVCHKITRQIC